MGGDAAEGAGQLEDLAQVAGEPRWGGCGLVVDWGGSPPPVALRPDASTPGVPELWGDEEICINMI